MIRIFFPYSHFRYHPLISCLVSPWRGGLHFGCLRLAFILHAPVCQLVYVLRLDRLAPLLLPIGTQKGSSGGDSIPRRLPHRGLHPITLNHDTMWPSK